MSDDQNPYTMAEMNTGHTGVNLARLVATVEALERAERERDEALASMFVALQERDWARTERDEETRKRYVEERALVEMTRIAMKAEAERDALRGLVGQRCDGIECDHARERDALKAALRDMQEHHCSCDFKETDEDCWTCNRATEALGEVET